MTHTDMKNLEEVRKILIKQQPAISRHKKIIKKNDLIPFLPQNEAPAYTNITKIKQTKTNKSLKNEHIHFHAHTLIYTHTHTQAHRYTTILWVSLVFPRCFSLQRTKYLSNTRLSMLNMHTISTTTTSMAMTGAASRAAATGSVLYKPIPHWKKQRPTATSRWDNIRIHTIRHTMGNGSERFFGRVARRFKSLRL